MLGSSLRLFLVVYSGTADELIFQARFPERHRDAVVEPSVAIKECPTRNFKVGTDIYTFAFTLCLKKKQLRKMGIFEEAIPTSFQA